MNIKDFFIKMVSSNTGVSSKRFSAFFTLVNIIVLTYIAAFSSENNTAPEFMFDALALIAGGGLGLTVIEKIFVKGEEEKKKTPEKKTDGESGK